jgi:iron-sulfur cluster insertion protein
MNAIVEMPAPIVFTESAAAKVAQLIEEEGNPDLKLRVFVQGGGCSTVSLSMRSSMKTTPP